MYLQIKQLILWPRSAPGGPRVVRFETGALNVISGVSKTGKSAIIPIIDYCLGAEKCAIPVQTIRWACSWFGVLLATARGELLLARREPGAQKSTGHMFMLESATSIALPATIEAPNTTDDRVKAMLNELAGLTSLDFDVEQTGGNVGFKSRPSFRDMMAFTFQPQSVVANPNVLFYKADTTEHREKLKTIFPYVLGAASAEALALQHERQRVSLDLRRKERDLDTVRRLSERWVAEVSADVSRARELGLLPVTAPADAPAERMLELLRGALAAADGQPLLTPSAVGAAADELAGLQREEARAALDLNALQRRIADMTAFRQAAGAYEGALEIRRDRLGVAEYVGQLFQEQHECPLCGTEESAAEAAIATLRAALRDVEEQTSAFERMPVVFDREEQRVRQDAERKAEQLNGVRVRRRALEARSDAARARQFLATNVARFAGYLESALERYDQLRTDGDLTGEVEALRVRLRTLNDRLAALDEESAKRRALARFASLAGRILPGLDTERTTDPVHLVIDDLTLRITGKDREDYLWEVGSGANWLAYHIATSIALHELFAEQRHSPVPGFVVYDQPSQVYFPRGMTKRRGARTDDGAGQETAATTLEQTPPADTQAPAAVAPATPNEQLSLLPAIEVVGTGADDAAENPDVPRSVPLDDADVQAVRQVFATLADAVARLKGEWQAIVLDHADQDVWGNISGVHLVEEWDGEAKLVPEKWVTTPTE